MLREIVENKHYKFADSAANWQEAIRMSCECLEADGTVDSTYSQQIIDCITKYGPYIIILPMVAMPHSQENAKGVNKTSIGFMKLNKPVSFEEGNPENDAMIFFTLASCNPDLHLKNVSRLSEMLIKEEVVDALIKAQGPEDLLEIQRKYLD